MVGILYFSSTGNSLYISKKLKEEIGGKIIYIPNYTGSGSEFEKLIIVTPIYSFGMPKHVYEMLPKLDKSKELIIVQNYGGMIGGANYLIYQYCLENGLNIKSVYTIKMPENFTITFTVPRFYINSTLKKADNRIFKVATKIKNSEYEVPKKKRTKIQTYLKNMSNWHIIGENFVVNNDCVKCGKCVKICPVKNISLGSEGIKFSDKCVACLGCYHRCPQKAITYKNNKKKDRYINPNILDNEIGKDF